MQLQLRLSNYITRYAPSREKLTMYLAKKKIQDIDALLANIGYHESLMCDVWMRTFIATGKGKRDIERKLFVKKFPHELILQKLEEYDRELHNWDEYVRPIAHQIDTLRTRGKSLRYIRMVLLEKYPYFRDEIADMLDEQNDTDALEKEVQKYKNKYNIKDKKELQKLYNALIQKGFSYADIRGELERSKE